MKPVLFAIFCLCWALPLAAQHLNKEEEAEISELNWMDRSYMAKQRGAVDDLARVNIGRPVRGDRSDLSLLQRIIDKQLVEPSETEMLQAMGVVLGDIYVNEHELVWRVYEDELGRSRAVCVEGTPNCLFPVTMLSRRIEAGVEPDVHRVYDKGLRLIQPYLPKLPFDAS